MLVVARDLFQYIDSADNFIRYYVSQIGLSLNIGLH